MAPSAFAELQRAPALAEQIYRRVRLSLRAGSFAPGERMVESALAQDLAVSRSPVREALARLAAEGLLESRANGFHVAAPNARDMAEIFEIRRYLEPPAMRQVARDADGALVAALRRCLEDTRAAHEADAFAAFVAANYAFRAAWVALVRNRRLAETILLIDDQSGFVRRKTLVRPAARLEVLALLKRTIAAFEANDEDAAATVTEAMIEGAERHYRETAAAQD